MTLWRRSSLIRLVGLLALLVVAMTACGSDKKKDSNLAPTIPATITLPPSRTPLSFTPPPTPTAFRTATPWQQAWVPSATPLILRPTTVYIPPTWTSLPAATAFPFDVRIAYPADGSLIAGYVTITGSASHPRFVQYALEWGPDPNPSNLWYPFLNPPQRTNIVLNGVLGSWDTRAIPDGNYQIRLHVWLNDGTDTWDLATGIKVSNTRPTVVPTFTPTQRPNRAPAINPIPSQQLTAGQAARLTVTTSDPDGDVVNLFVASSNPSVANAQVTAPSEITISGASAGTATITVTANDNHGGVVNTAFIVTVIGQNRAPAISPVPNQTLNVGQTLPVTLAVSDPDNDALTVAAVPDSTAIVATSTAGTTITLTGVAAGTTNVTVSASDNKGGVVNTIFQVTVRAPNTPPTVNPIQAQSMTVGAALDVPYTASDVDGDVLSAVAQSDNQGVVSASILAPGTIHLVANGAGSANVTLSVSDPTNPVVSTSFGVTVSTANANPVIQPVSDQAVQAGSSVTVAVSASDPDNDPLTLNAASDNPGVVAASASGSAVILNGLAPGTATITLTVTDNRGGTASATFLATVAAANSNPSIQAVGDQTVQAGASTMVPVIASDPDNDPLTLSAVSDNPAVVSATASGSEVILNGLTPGSATITVDASDNRGGMASTTFLATVVGTNTPPVIQPIGDQSLKVGEQIAVPVALSDAEGDALVLTAISQNAGVVVATAVGTDTVMLEGISEGVTSIQLTADDARGGVTNASFNVTVSSAAPTFDLMAYPILPEISPQMASNLSLIYQGGLGLGNQAGAFSKVGDDAMDSTNFLAPFAAPGSYDLGNYGTLQPTIDFFASTSVRPSDPAINSFNADSVAAGSGYGIETLSDPAPAGPPCDSVGGTVLSCEYQVTHPSIALISFSAPNVTYLPPDQFRSELQSLVYTTQSTYGVIPVLATIPAGGGYSTEQLTEYNRAIVEVATQSGVPLWNLWRAMQERGISDPNSVAPEGPANLTDAALNYDVNIRNLTALQTLEAVRQAAGIQ